MNSYEEFLKWRKRYFEMELKKDIHGRSWKAVEIVLEVAKSANNGSIPLRELRPAIERVEQMLREEPERFIEI